MGKRGCHTRGQGGSVSVRGGGAVARRGETNSSPVLALRKMVVPHPQDWVLIVLPQCREGGPVTCVLPICTCMGGAHYSRRRKAVSMLSSDVKRRWHQKVKSFRICAPGPLHLKSQQCHWRPWPSRYGVLAMLRESCEVPTCDDPRTEKAEDGCNGGIGWRGVAGCVPCGRLECAMLGRGGEHGWLARAPHRGEGAIFR